MRSRTDHRARLEPATGILHGAGQDPQSLTRYAEALGPDLRPCMSMHYVGLKGDLAAWGRGLKQQLDAAPWWTMPQIGLSMTRDSQPHLHYEGAVAEGTHDGAIEALCDALEQLGRPAWLRIGFEFNGPWNGYQPATFIAAWRRIVARVRARRLDVATVWCAGLTLDDRAIPWDFWPGDDDQVDWCGLDLFFPEDLHDRRSLAFLAACAERGKPVMIGESTPRTVGLDRPDEAWARWFAPYLRCIDEHPHIKAFCYINWEWAIQSVNWSIDWLNWGDSRLERAPAIAERWARALRDPSIIHAGDPQRLRALLARRGS